MASAMNSRVERRKVINSHIYTVLIKNLSHQKYLKLFHFQNDLLRTSFIKGGKRAKLVGGGQERALLMTPFSVQLSRSVVSDSLWPHGLHARPPCPSPTPGVDSNSCPLSQWCHPTISSSVISFSSCLQSFSVSGSLKWVSSSQQVAKVLEFQLQNESFQTIFRIGFL